MAGYKLHTFVKALRNSSELRREFARSPGDTLIKFGFDPDLLELPKQINLDELENTFGTGVGGSVEPAMPSAKDLKDLSVDELWEKFKFLKFKPEADFTPATSFGVTLSGVVYGTTPTTAQSTITTQSTSVGLGGDRNAPRSFDQIRQLRDLVKSKQDGLNLTFGVSSPDGVRVSGISATTLRAFLKRVDK